MSTPSQTANDRFYNDLPPFRRFDDFTMFEAYAPVPDDWVVMIADVVGSTRAIEAGNYKAVNMVGAASITAVLNTKGGTEIPFVFGGDGGTLVVPGALGEAAGDALLRLQAASEDLFGLTLRVGAIPVADLRAQGHDVRVRKFELSPGNYLAMFAGGGVERADALLKGGAPGGAYLPAGSGDPGPPDLAGLSCRWEPLTPKNGRMMTLMVQGRASDPGAEGKLLGEVLAAIGDILGDPLTDFAPASRHSMRFRWPPRGLRLEARASRGTQSHSRRLRAVLVSSLIQYVCERFNLKAGDYDPPVYRKELRANTDFRKYDGLFRAVLDVSPDQAARIETYLEGRYRAGRLVYGLQLADRALMTCLVFNLARSEHVHFVDGADGGFAMAARAFKARLDHCDAIAL
ncbi:MAG TPA: DUF3095 domain-containing protein [Alphaproteobacteria bacterium]|nr:DUF3095 domain-containing protein [Alphaproteobacteria bacterium]